MLSEEFIYEAVHRVGKNKGAGTKGTDRKSFDGFGKGDIIELRKRLKERTYQPREVKRVYIPKPGKNKKRPLGIPTFTDRIVQQMLNEILTAIYEPIFEGKHGNANFGFRKGKGVRQALDKIKRKTKEMRWCLEGDIEGAYDCVNHEKLLSILREKIDDERFIELINKFLKSGVMENGKRRQTLIGTPQGGIVSPILFNIYMAKFDEFMLNKMEEESEKEEKEGKKEKPERNKEYNKTTNKIGNHVKWIRKKHAI